MADNLSRPRDPFGKRSSHTATSVCGCILMGAKRAGLKRAAMLKSEAVLGFPVLVLVLVLVLLLSSFRRAPPVSVQRAVSLPMPTTKCAPVKPCFYNNYCYSRSCFFTDSNSITGDQDQDSCTRRYCRSQGARSCNLRQDCGISTWSKWYQCSRSCGGGASIRNRSIVTMSSGGGLKCTQVDLEESIPCNEHKCPVIKIDITCTVQLPYVQQIQCFGAQFGWADGVENRITAAEMAIQVPHSGCGTGTNDSNHTHSGCENNSDISNVRNKISVVRRGNCSFARKTSSAQALGAIALFVVNNEPGDAQFMRLASGDFIEELKIPTVMISQQDGDKIFAILLNGGIVHATIAPKSMALDDEISQQDVDEVAAKKYKPSGSMDQALFLSKQNRLYSAAKELEVLMEKFPGQPRYLLFYIWTLQDLCLWGKLQQSRALKNLEHSLARDTHFGAAGICPQLQPTLGLPSRLSLQLCALHAIDIQKAATRMQKHLKLRPQLLRNRFDKPGLRYLTSHRRYDILWWWMTRVLTLGYLSSPRPSRRRVVVAYISSGFTRNHPIHGLMHGVFSSPSHDLDRATKPQPQTPSFVGGIDSILEVHCISLAQGIQPFHILRGCHKVHHNPPSVLTGDESIVGDDDMTNSYNLVILLDDLQVDVVVDLDAYTRSSHVAYLAYCPGAVRLHYLGQPIRTIGAPFVDYFIVDAVVWPAEAEALYTRARNLENSCSTGDNSTKHVRWEKLVVLPIQTGSFYLASGGGQLQGQLPRDGEGDANAGRLMHGLPLLTKNSRTFVFASFNKAKKLDEEVFSCWCLILQLVPRSVLWLTSVGTSGQAQLRREAEARGISVRRLIFGRYLPNRRQHLSRLGLADLCLDTLEFNAGSVALDAIQAGVPLLTRIGPTDKFSARMGASVLSAMKIPILVTHTLQEYVNLAVQLATSPKILRSLRRFILQNLNFTITTAKAHGSNTSNARESSSTYSVKESACVIVDGTIKSPFHINSRALHLKRGYLLSVEIQAIQSRTSLDATESEAGITTCNSRQTNQNQYHIVVGSKELNLSRTKCNFSSGVGSWSVSKFWQHQRANRQQAIEVNQALAAQRIAEDQLSQQQQHVQSMEDERIEQLKKRRIARQAKKKRNSKISDASQAFL